MATLQHEGHSNQLDLLIRASNVLFVYANAELGCCRERAASCGASAAALQPAALCREVMEGNQEVITLVATCMAKLQLKISGF